MWKIKRSDLQHYKCLLNALIALSSFKVALYYQLTVCCVRQIIFSKFLTDTLKKIICILLIFLWIRRVSALPRHPVMNSRIQLLVTMAILRRRYRNRLMLLSSPFVLRIYSLPPPFIFEQNSHKGGWWLIQRIKTKVIIVVILTQDKLQGYEWDKKTPKTLNMISQTKHFLSFH